MSAFDDPADAVVFARVCEQHTDVIPSEGYSGLAQGDERQRRRVVAELQHEVRTLRRARGDDLAESARAHMYRALALEDPLTGLPNFRAFHDRVERASESREQMTLLLVDVDQLKEINEQQGHAAGDAVLIEVGRSIVDELLPGDVAARVGGDEFGVLLSPRSGPDAAAIAELIRAGVQQRCSADNATVSIGGTGCDIDRSGATLSADRALYESKLHGRNRVTFSASVGRPSAQ